MKPRGKEMIVSKDITTTFDDEHGTHLVINAKGRTDEMRIQIVKDGPNTQEPAQQMCGCDIVLDGAAVETLRDALTDWIGDGEDS